MTQTSMKLMLEYVERTKHFELSDELENALMDFYVQEASFFTDNVIRHIEFMSALMPDAKSEVFIESLKIHVNFEGGF